MCTQTHKTHIHAQYTHADTPHLSTSQRFNHFNYLVSNGASACVSSAIAPMCGCSFRNARPTRTCGDRLHILCSRVPVHVIVCVCVCVYKRTTRLDDGFGARDGHGTCGRLCAMQQSHSTAYGCSSNPSNTSPFGPYLSCVHTHTHLHSPACMHQALAFTTAEVERNDRPIEPRSGPVCALRRGARVNSAGLRIFD